MKDVSIQERMGRRAKIGDEAWYRKRAIYDMYYTKFGHTPRLREIHHYEQTGELVRLNNK